MKKMKVLIISSLVLLLGTFSSCKRQNNTSSSSSSYVEHYNDERTVLTYHEESDSYSFKMKPDYKNTKETIQIPEIYNEKKVTEIEENAFKDYEYLNELVIPTSVTKIGKSSLEGCVRLQKLTLPFVGETKNSNNFLGYLFGEEKYSSYISLPQYLRTITVSNATSLGDGAFYGLESLENIVLNEGLLSLGKEVFNRCNKISSIVLPNSVKEIGDYSFKDCENLETVFISSSIEKVGEEVFRNCNKLKFNYDESSSGYYLGNGKSKYLFLLDIKEGTSTITPNVECRIIYLKDKDLSLVQSINVTKNVKDIFLSSVNGWEKLTSASVDSNNKIFDSRNNCNSIIRTSTNDLVFGTKNSKIPNDIVSIAEEAFKGKIIDRSVSLKNLIIPNSVTSIGEYAFEGCIGLGTITLGTGMNSIPEGMFSGCENLHNVVIPNSYDMIGNNAFNGCSHLEAIYFGCSEEEYKSGAIQMDAKTKNQFDLVNKYFDWKNKQ